MAFLDHVTKIAEIADHRKPELQNYKEIKPETSMTEKGTKNFWDSLFKGMETEKTAPKDIVENKLEKAVSEYFDDLKSKSEVKDTLPDKPFEASDLKKLSPEENAVMREEFRMNKDRLIQQWEEKNGCSWPTYKEDVYITTQSGEQVQIQKAGDRYDAHHIQPLGLGGKNEADNITPLHLDVHRDHKGVHAPDSPYDRMDKISGGNSGDK